MANAKRSPAQLKNDRRLGRLAKERARKNPRKKASATRKRNPESSSERSRAAKKAWRARKRNPETSSERSRAAKKAWRARKRNPETSSERSRAAKKAWRARKRNPQSSSERSRAARAGWRGRRPTRKNPSMGWDGVKMGLLAAAVGGGAAVASSWLNDGPLGNRGPRTQGVAILVEAIAAALWITNPIVMAAAVVGISVVPVASVVYRFAPRLASPVPMGPPMPDANAPSTAVVVVSAGAPPSGPPPATAVSALHQANIGKLRAVDKAISALHKGGSMGALHETLGALHHGQIAALHAPAMAALAAPRARGFSVRGVDRYALSGR